MPQVDENQRGTSAIGKHQRNGSFSKTMSKTMLLNKIKTAMHKQGEIRKLNLEVNGQKKTPRRFIVKRSQERKAEA